MARWKNINGVLQKIAGSVRIDQVLNKLSRNAISNKAVSEKFEEVDLSLEICADDMNTLSDNVSALSDRINKHFTELSANDIVSYDNLTFNTEYIAPTDGYVWTNSSRHSGNVVYVEIGNTIKFSAGGMSNLTSTFIRKGTHLKWTTDTGADNIARFYKLG